MASSIAGGNPELVFSNGNVSTGNLSFSATGGWQNRTTISANVTLNAGVQILRINMNSSGFNVNRIDVISSGSQDCEEYAVPLASDWIIRNSWSDQSNGSAFSNTAEALVFTHRSWGQEYAFLIFNNEPFNITQGDNYEISFDVRDADSKIISLQAGLCTGWQWDGPTGYRQPLITCDAGYSSSSYTAKSVNFTGSSSGTAYIVIRVNLNRSAETPDFLFKNLSFCTDGNALKSKTVSSPITAFDAKDVKVYSNPVMNNQVTIELPDGMNEVLTVSMIHLNGRCIVKNNFPAGLHKIELKDIRVPAGMYYLHLSGNSINQYHKLVVK